MEREILAEVLDRFDHMDRLIPRGSPAEQKNTIAVLVSSMTAA